MSTATRSVPFVVHHGPAGLEVTGAGAVTWPAVGPMFDRVADSTGEYGLRDHPEALLAGSIRITDASRQLPLARSGIVVPQQREQLLVADLDGNGTGEILTANATLLAAMNKSGAAWAQSWVSRYQLSVTTESPIDSLAAADVTGDASKEIFVATGGRVLQLSGSDRSVRRQVNLGDPDFHCAAMRVADLDGNGTKELVCRRADYGTNSSTVLVLNAAELTAGWNAPVSIYGTSLAVGNVDAILRSRSCWAKATYLTEQRTRTSGCTVRVLARRSKSGILTVTA